MLTLRNALLLTSLLSLSACLVPSGEPLVSAQSPGGTGLVNAQSEPQPAGSLPPGAASGGTGMFSTEPDFASIRIGGR